MSMIKAFIFDWGNVLHLIDQDGFIKEMAERYSVDYHTLREVEREARHAMDAGFMSTEKYIAEIENSCGIKIDAREYHQIFFSKYVTLNYPLIEYIRNLNDKKLKKRYYLVLLSNNNPPFYEFMKKRTRFEKMFDKILISYQHKMKKPDPRFYRKALEGTRIKPEECLYVDDRNDLAKAAKKLGMHPIVYTTFEQFLKEVRKFAINGNRSQNQDRHHKQFKG